MLNSYRQKQVKKKVPLTTFCLYSSIFFAPWRSYGFVIVGVTFSLFRIFAILFFLSFFVWIIGSNKRLVVDKVLKVLFLILILSIFAIVYSSSISGTVSNFASVVFGFFWLLIAYSFVKTNKDLSLNSIIICFTFSAVYPLIIGFFQYFYFLVTKKVPDLPFQFMAVINRDSVNYGTSYTRIFSTFGDPTYYACFLSSMIILLLGIIINKKNTTFSRRILLIFSIVLVSALAQLLMSLSISGIIGTVLGLMLMVLLLFGTRGFVKVLFAFFSLFLVFSVLLLTNNTIANLIISKLNYSSQTIDNFFGRKDFIVNALNVFINHPLFGGGFGSLRINGMGFSTAHSSFLTILGQQGIFVLLLHLILLIAYPIHNIKYFKGSTKFYSILFFSMLFGVLVISIAYDILYSMDVCYILIFLNIFQNAILVKKEVNCEKSAGINVYI